MQDLKEQLEPASLWRHFETLARIPRPSRAEDAALDHIRQWAGLLEYETFAAGERNLLVRVPASPGRENAPAVILQAHIDMVCERRPDSPNDPSEGRVVLVRDGDWLSADGTTLGADNGIGIAAMMAAAEASDLRRGPLELLVTTAEEIGLEGAKEVDGSLFQGRMLLNLDSEEDGTLTVGCSGGTDSLLRVDEAREPARPGETALAVRVHGGAGGHSGVDIARGRANAVKVLARCLRQALAERSFRLASLEGGKSRNAIPREAEALVLVLESEADALKVALNDAQAQEHAAFSLTDPGISLSISETSTSADAWSDGGTERILDVVASLPSGPLAMSQDFRGLVATSTSLGVATTDDTRLELQSLTRTSDEAALPEVLNTLSAIARLAGGELEVHHGYPGWRPDLQSPLLALCRSVWVETFGAEPVVTAMHAGLETALIGAKIPGLDMLSIGPQIESPHSPGERVSIPSVQRFWMFLTAVLDRLSAA